MKKISFHLNQAYSRMMSINGEPRPVALGYALGTFLAASPLMGVHCVLAVIIAGACRWNRLSAGIGALSSNLLIAPVLYSGTYLVGSKILGLNEILKVPESFDELLSQSSEALLALSLGGIIVGIPLAVSSYFICYFVVKRYRSIQILKSESHETRL
jgi:hypothetical protein